MSEYQYVGFQAVDGPLSDEQLAFARRQSTRAEVSRWSLSVEYHYSSFRGDVDGLLQRGYDVYLQHTNYGIREIKLRLPHGMPFASGVWKKYVDGERLHWKSDTRGSGGILTLCPFHEGGDLELVAKARFAWIARSTTRGRPIATRLFRFARTESHRHVGFIGSGTDCRFVAFERWRHFSSWRSWFSMPAAQIS